MIRESRTQAAPTHRGCHRGSHRHMVALLAPTTATQAAITPTVTWTGVIVGANAGFPVLFCNVGGEEIGLMVDEIKGNSRADWTVNITVVQNGQTQFVAGSGPFITKADNGVQQTTFVIGAGTILTNNVPMTFDAFLVDPVKRRSPRIAHGALSVWSRS
jgi:hypothetical protein